MPMTMLSSVPGMATPPRRRGRPPANTPTLDTRDVLIRTGLALLTEKGYVSAGLDEVLRLAQVPKGSFYHQFETKEAFGLALIDAYAAYFAAKLDRWLLDDRQPPLSRLHHFIDDARVGMQRHAYARGCLVGNLGQELASLPASFRAQLEAVFQDWQARVARCLQEARDRGDLASTHDCARLAHFFWIGWEGAVLRAKLTRSAEPLDVYAQGFFALLNHHDEAGQVTGPRR